jgi:hypothetical protein
MLILISSRQTPLDGAHEVPVLSFEGIHPEFHPSAYRSQLASPEGMHDHLFVCRWPCATHNHTVRGTKRETGYITELNHSIGRNTMELHIDGMKMQA